MTPPTGRQAEFLDFIDAYTRLNGRAPAEADMQRYFGVTPPSVHQMVLSLEKRGLIERTPGHARSIRVLFAPDPFSASHKRKAASMSTAHSILGHWRITHMDNWDQDFVDAEVEGYVRLEKGGRGEFQFGYVCGVIDHELTKRDGKPATEWSWEGNDEMDEVRGRGWAVLEDEGTIRGKLAIHQGDKSGFVAVRKTSPGHRRTGR